MALRFCNSLRIPKFVREEWKAATHKNNEAKTRGLLSDYGDVMLDVEWYCRNGSNGCGYALHHAAGSRKSICLFIVGVN